MNTSDIVGWTPLKPISLGRFNQVRARLIKKGWQVEHFIAKTEAPCACCKQDTVVTVVLHQQRADERSFDICFTCGTATEQQPIFEKPSKRLNKTEVLQTLVDQIPQLDGSQVEFKRGHGFYIQTANPIYFQYYDVALHWLTDWIATGVRPSDALRRVGAMDNWLEEMDQVR